MPGRIVSIDEIVGDAWRATALLTVIIRNRVDLALPADRNQNRFVLPTADPERPLSTYVLDVSREEGPWTLDLFREDV